MNDRRRRSMQLFVVSVITAALCLMALYIMVSIWVVEKAKGDEEPEAPQQQSITLPQLCAPLYNRGLHRFWASCMNVGYDDTPIDRHLYANKGND